MGDIDASVKAARDVVLGDQTNIYQSAPAQPAAEELLATALDRLAGLGGIGKTQLAAEFAHRYGSYFAGGVFWLSFAGAQNVPTEVAACGGRAYLNLAPDFEQLDLPTQLQLVLSAWQSPLPRLLIFDNCEDETLLQQWRPATGGSRILITSRRASWDSILNVHPLPLNVLPRSESIALLLKYLASPLPHQQDSSPVPPGANEPGEGAPPPPLPQQQKPGPIPTGANQAGEDPNASPAGRGGWGVRAIAAELGDLPLALDLAGSFLKTYRRVVSPEQYLAQLRRPNLLDHPSLQGRAAALSPTGHDRHVFKTFLLSYDRLDPNDPTDALTRDILARAARFAPGEPLPIDLLLAAVETGPDDPDAPLLLEDALHRLLDLGLLTPIEIDPSSSPHWRAGGAVLLHRLLAHFIHQVTPDPSEAQSAVEKAIMWAMDEQYDQAGYLFGMLPLQTHLRAVTTAALVRKDEQAAHLSNRLGYYLKQTGDLAAARPYYEQALAIRSEVLGERHPDTAQSLNNLGYLLQDLGDLAAARPYFEQALAILEARLGPAHPYTQIVRDNLAGLDQA